MYLPARTAIRYGVSAPLPNRIRMLHSTGARRQWKAKTDMLCAIRIGAPEKALPRV
jgi:hypothetical protein